MRLNIKKASFGLRVIIGLLLAVLFIFAYEEGRYSLSYQITGFSVQEMISNEPGFFGAGIVLLITIYFIVVIVMEMIKMSEPQKEKTIQDYINE